MTKEQFAEQILAMQQTMYRVSCGILRREADREDAVQECICKAWQKKDTLKDEGAFRAWVLRILVNECYDICRRSSRVVLTDEMPESIAPSDDEPRSVREAILRLEDLYRLPITLFYIEGFTIREIADILKVPEGTVKSRLHTGRSKLKGFLSEEVHA